jgi:anti-sigma factor ChrR (cupin superfamily)
MKKNQNQDEIIEQAASYALGTLSEEEARDFEKKVAEGCDECKEEFNSFAAIVARIGLAAAEEHPPAGLKEKLFDEITAQETAEKSRINSRTVRESITLRMEEGKWIEPWQGVRVKRLFVDKERGTVTTLFKMAPGSRIPSHRHHSIEECLVIEGDYHINGEQLGPGDYHCAMPGSTDETLTTIGGTTFVLVSAPDHEFL